MKRKNLLPCRNRGALLKLVRGNADGQEQHKPPRVPAARLGAAFPAAGRAGPGDHWGLRKEGRSCQDAAEPSQREFRRRHRSTQEFARRTSPRTHRDNNEGVRPLQARSTWLLALQKSLERSGFLNIPGSKGRAETKSLSQRWKAEKQTIRYRLVTVQEIVVGFMLSNLALQSAFEP